MQRDTELGDLGGTYEDSAYAAVKSVTEAKNEKGEDYWHTQGRGSNPLKKFMKTPDGVAAIKVLIDQKKAFADIYAIAHKKMEALREEEKQLGVTHRTGYRALAGVDKSEQKRPEGMAMQSARDALQQKRESPTYRFYASIERAGDAMRKGLPEQAAAIQEIQMVLTTPRATQKLTKGT
jgi:hypothetical protein